MRGEYIRDRSEQTHKFVVHCLTDRQQNSSSKRAKRKITRDSQGRGIAFRMTIAWRRELANVISAILTRGLMERHESQYNFG
jgi:hypothetical protein